MGVRKLFAVGTLLVASAWTARAGDNGQQWLCGGTDESYNLFNPVPKNKLRELDTDRPDQATGGHTVDAGHFQLEMDFANYTLDRHTPERDGQELDQWNVAPFSLRIGLLPNVELDIEHDGYFNARSRNPQTRSDQTASGFGDLTLRSKLNLFGNDKGKVALAVVPVLRLPTSSADLASKSVEGGAALALSVELPADFTVTVSSGVEFIRNSTDAYYVADFTNYLSVQHSLGIKPLSAFVEFASEVDTESPSPVSAQVDTGVLYQLNDNVQLDVDCYFGVTRNAPDFMPFAGLSVRF